MSILWCASGFSGMSEREEKSRLFDATDSLVSSDALVLFGATGDLVHKKIFPALYALAKRGILSKPVVGVARQPWNLLHQQRAEDGIKFLQIDDRQALIHFFSLLRYVEEIITIRVFISRSTVLADSRRPAHYLAIPRFCYGYKRIGWAGLAEMQESSWKNPGRDLASARIKQYCKIWFPEESIFRIDHYLGKEAIMNTLFPLCECFS